MANKRGSAVAKRTDEQIFLDTLIYMAGSPPSRVSSRALSQELEWKEDRFHRSRSRLVDSGVIKGVTGGPGGSLELFKGSESLVANEPSALGPKPISAFVSYSHADAKLKAELIKHLAPLERLKLVSHWHDGEIKPGDHWEKVIIDKMAEAKLVLLLISSDFIASEFCYQNELAEALKRDKAKTARVLPIILRPCLWDGLPFCKLQATPPEAKPVTSWDNIDHAMTEVAKAVREAAQALRDG
jgi:hypothetical protein